jgi:hypothetical protein
MNDPSPRADTGPVDRDAPAAASRTAELLRRAESVRTTLIVAGIALVFALTLIVQANQARRAAERPLADTGSAPARAGAPARNDMHRHAVPSSGEPR